MNASVDAVRAASRVDVPLHHLAEVVSQHELPARVAHPLWGGWVLTGVVSGGFGLLAWWSVTAALEGTWWLWIVAAIAAFISVLQLIWFVPKVFSTIVLRFGSEGSKGLRLVAAELTTDLERFLMRRALVLEVGPILVGAITLDGQAVVDGEYTAEQHERFAQRKAVLVDGAGVRPVPALVRHDWRPVRRVASRASAGVECSSGLCSASLRARSPARLITRRRFDHWQTNPTSISQLKSHQVSSSFDTQLAAPSFGWSGPKLA